MTYRVVCEKCGVVKTGLTRRWATYEKDQHANGSHRAFDRREYAVRVEREA